MADYIPFVTGDDAYKLFKKHYSDASMVRVPLERASSILASNGDTQVWLDPSVDGLDDLEARKPKTRKNPWYDFIRTFPHSESIASPSFQSRPKQASVNEFVKAVLAKCWTLQPAWITVPQLPMVEGNDRNKINRALAKATGLWRSEESCSARFMLPLIFTNQNQLKGKTERRPKLDVAAKCYNDCQADGVWVVDMNVTDDSGSRTLRNKRFPAIIDLHEELRERIPSATVVGGPYWGMNLVLWARGLVDHPAIGVGNAYKYYLSGGFARQPSAKLAIGPLRRRCSVAPSTKGWLDEVLKLLPTSHPSYPSFLALRNKFSLLDRGVARVQVALAYKEWFDAIAKNPVSGRSMALYQDLSAAYALGKSLPDIPRHKTARRPESVAEPLMLSCL
jgi:hypothetical protein